MNVFKENHDRNTIIYAYTFKCCEEKQNWKELCWITKKIIMTW